VIAGSAREEKLEGAVAKNAAPPPATGVSYRGRTIIYFVDDLHLSADSVQRTRKAINDFVDNDMSLDDQVAIATPTGQSGFLQRFSDLKPVVRAAVNRLNHKPYTVRNLEQISMTEYQAMRIEQGDQSAIDYFSSVLTVIYNASASPKLESQIEILRGGQRVVASPVMPVAVEANSDTARIPYGANVGLKTLAPGRYALKVTVTDRNVNTSAVNQIIFEVE
jgi:hypothetical protein